MPCRLAAGHAAQHDSPAWVHGLPLVCASACCCSNALLRALLCQQPLTEHNPPCSLQAAVVKNMTRLVQRLAKPEALQLLQSCLLPGLVAAFNHSSADVRKAVVFCLVDLWMVGCHGAWLCKPAPLALNSVAAQAHGRSDTSSLNQMAHLLQVLGEELTPHLAPLSTSQLKLVTIYITRRQQQST